MNISNNLKQIILTGCCLLLVSTQALADRPAMSERSETIEPEIIDLSTDVQEIPVFEELPTQGTAPEMDEISAVEVDMQQQEQQAVEAEPIVHVYDHRTETEITGDVIELQPGDSLPVTVLDFPRRGMTMDKVKNELGQPLEASEAIGQPPITSWTYNDRIVYFEYSSVVHVVATH
ncbi:MAG: hypothetical protein OEY66_01030 [Gammaproteobacteria bacterium]|nr:hypothetical protein [Gammaproteobacteria bacterium]